MSPALTWRTFQLFKAVQATTRVLPIHSLPRMILSSRPIMLLIRWKLESLFCLASSQLVGTRGDIWLHVQRLVTFEQSCVSKFGITTFQNLVRGLLLRWSESFRRSNHAHLTITPTSQCRIKTGNQRPLHDYFYAVSARNTVCQSARCTLPSSCILANTWGPALMCRYQRCFIHNWIKRGFSGTWPNSIDIMDSWNEKRHRARNSDSRRKTAEVPAFSSQKRWTSRSTPRRHAVDNRPCCTWLWWIQIHFDHQSW